MRTYFLPTKEQCDLICEKNEAFFAKHFTEEGQEVVVYNYFLAQFKDFSHPLVDYPEITAQELRGLTFVKEGDSWKRFIMLSKFYNINQSVGWMEEDVRKQTILRTQDKLDGSMIRFIPFANGKIRAKTKMGFDNEQSLMAQAYFDAHPKFQEFIKDTLNQGLAAIVELVSCYNKIVLDYQETELILIQLRDESTGVYLDIYDHDLVKKHNVKCTAQEPVQTLDWYLEQAKVLTQKEGWVIQTDQILFKVKTQWYFDLHGLLTDSLTREDQILSLILNEKLDDAFQQLSATDVRRTFAESVQKAVTSYMVKFKDEAVALAKTFNGNRKDFALANLKNPMFHFAILVVDNPDNMDEVIYNRLKQVLLKKTLFEAKDFLKTLGLEAPKGAFFVEEDN